LPAIWQQLVEAVGRPTVGELGEHGGEIGQQGHVVQGGGAQEAVEGRGAAGGVVGSGEEVVLATERDVADLALAEVVVEVEAAVVEEAGERVPVIEEVG
jgi:hypothetical protein